MESRFVFQKGFYILKPVGYFAKMLWWRKKPLVRSPLFFLKKKKPYAQPPKIHRGSKANFLKKPWYMLGAFLGYFDEIRYGVHWLEKSSRAEPLFWKKKKGLEIQPHVFKTRVQCLVKFFSTPGYLESKKQRQSQG